MKKRTEADIEPKEHDVEDKKKEVGGREGRMKEANKYIDRKPINKHR